MKIPEKNNPALTPCIKTECPQWDNGMCFSIRKVGQNCIRIQFPDSTCQYGLYST